MKMTCLLERLISNGIIFHFKLNDERTELKLNDELIDKVAGTDKELDDVIFAKGLG